MLPVGLAGELGTPRAYAAYNRVADIVERSVAGSPTDGAHHRPRGHRRRPHRRGAERIACRSSSRSPYWSSLVLLLVYRNAVTMLLPLVTIGSSLVIAQAVVAGFSQLTGSGVSNQSIIFLSAIMAGAGTDYAVFLISRYHDYLRAGADFDQAVKAAMISIGKVITASATTVGITFLLLSFAKMGVFRTVGVSAAIGIGVAYLAGSDAAAGHPGAGRAARLGQAAARTDRPVLAAFRDPHRAPAGAASGGQRARPGAAGQLSRVFAHFNYDDRKAVRRRRRARSGMPRWNATSPSASPSPNTSSSSRRMTCAPRRPSRTWSRWPRASPSCRTSVWSAASPDPWATVPPEFRATYQAGLVGDRLADGSAQIDQRTGDLNRLATGANTLADNLSRRARPGQQDRAQHPESDRLGSSMRTQ